MEQTESKKNLVNYYLIPLFLVLFQTSIGFFTLFIFKDELNKPNVKVSLFLIPLFSLVFFYFSAKIIITYYKKTLKIIVENSTIEIDNNIYYWEEIKFVKYSGKNHFSFLSNGAKESMIIKFQNGDSYIIYDFLYSNIDKIKSFIFKKTNINSKTEKQVDIIEDDNYFQFKGNQFLCISGIALWGFLIFFIYIFIKDSSNKSPSFIIFFITMLIVWVLYHNSMLNYFLMSKSHLKIQNHNIPFYSKKICLITIKEVVLESPYKRPFALLIINQNFETKRFFADSLKSSDWKKLKREFIKQNIKVRDEIT